MNFKALYRAVIPLAILIVLFSGCISSPEEGAEEVVTDIGDFPNMENPLPEVPEENVIPAQPAGADITGGEEVGEAEDSSKTGEIGAGELPYTTRSLSDAEEQNKTIRVGAFNIQVFGVTKASKPEVMEILAQIIRSYDVVAIQEIRDSSQTSLPQLVEAVNSEGANYEYVVSERLGRTTSKEQYAYVYDSTRLRLAGEPHTYPEPEGTDPFHRQPYIAGFELPGENFSFVLLTVHTDPDEAEEEINYLDEAVEYARTVYPEEDDFILMGDLNADGSYYDEDAAGDLSGADYHWLIDNSVDTTTKATDYTYDRIIVSEGAESLFTGDSGVFRYDLAYNLTYDETTAVSDHYPVYAEFLTYGDEF